MSRGLDEARILRLLEAAERRLEGEWVLVGGALAAIWFSPSRVTEDVDLVGLQGTNEERLALMQLAQEEGLPVEAVNSAADFFLRKIPGWRDELEVLRRAARLTVYRPSPTLFLLLKLRLGEQDLEDCAELLAFARTHDLEVDRERVVAALDALGPTDDAALAVRRTALRAALTAHRG
ncbi:MAG: hypothetical protein KF729_28610 [Sandaracinaceae bacterium]|nr:hypothetical protein [Sandaracinaceae bacterium]